MRVILFSYCFLAYHLFAYSQSIETVIQKGHELAVITVAMSPDSNYVATVNRDKKQTAIPTHPYTFSRGQDFPVVIESEK